jgi:cation transporter-like permease
LQLRVYAILLGDFGLFNRESFFSVFSVCLVVLYTFMVVLVLLNVLIAVASDSVRPFPVRATSKLKMI